MKTTFLFLLALLSTGLAHAQGLPSATSIVQKTNAVDEGVQLTRELTMILTDKRGKSRTRETVSFRKYLGKEKRLAIFYEQPSNVKGTAFLVYDYPEAGKDDDQWLYMPALRKTRRISAANRGDYFLGTDLTYEDIKLEAKASQDDYRYQTLGVEEVDGHQCYVLEGIPVDDKVKKELGYSKIKLYIDRTIYLNRRIDSWDEAGNPLKTVKLSEIKKVQNILTYHRIDVNNHKTGHSTVFVFDQIDYTTPVSDDFFTEQALQRGI